MKQLFRFVVVGSLGFLVDAGVLQVLIFALGTNPYLARIFSFLGAASTTWWLNRHYTFSVRHAPSQREWGRYLSLMILGAAINYGAYALCLVHIPRVSAQPWLGVAAGSLAGLWVNFLTSRRLFGGHAQETD